MSIAQILAAQGPLNGVARTRNALNFNPDANVDDGSCTYPILGCTDPQALNYNPWATDDDGSCQYPVLCDSGQVMVDVYVCVFSNGDNIGFELADDQGKHPCRPRWFIMMAP